MSEDILPTYTTDEQALSELLKLEPSIYISNVKDSEGKEIAAIYVNANDVFWWGCADSEPLSVDDIHDFYNMIKENPYGQIKWLCLKRKMRPQHPWEILLKKAGYWDDELEALPVRDYTG